MESNSILHVSLSRVRLLRIEEGWECMSTCLDNMSDDLHDSVDLALV